MPEPELKRHVVCSGSLDCNWRCMVSYMLQGPLGNEAAGQHVQGRVRLRVAADQLQCSDNELLASLLPLLCANELEVGLGAHESLGCLLATVDKQHILAGCSMQLICARCEQCCRELSAAKL